MSAFEHLVAGTGPRTIADLARAFVLAEQDNSVALCAYNGTWPDDDPRWLAHERRTDATQDKLDDAKDDLAAAFDALGLDASLREKLVMWL